MTEFLTAPRPIRSVLIANRGEIACRIIATCHRLGLRAIAVYSAADANARHVRLADAAYPIGGSSPSESYLVIDNIIAAAQASGVDAIHPGYGFLSENPAFVRAVENEGLIFIGPSSDAVERMGSKIIARQIAKEAGVPVVPGFDAPAASDKELAEAADRIGYPVLVKASAGGGGRGMRRADGPSDLSDALDSARKEAASAFGDATVFLEKLILNPRHLEVQVFGDGAGQALHFHDRDCSVQRNHQKVIEEAPSPNLPEKVRNAIFDYAIRLTAAINYSGAGTVEFVIGIGESAPYFLEMNTRLQVEHPVTEAICGIDLVEWQLRQAAGLPLPLAQTQIRPKGHAIEVRLNAERPEAGFMPDLGRISILEVPNDIRFDTGIEAGDVISSHYDSMLAKLIAYGPNREAALGALVDGIDRMAIAGVGTNLAFLRDCLVTPAFGKGLATTSFLSETFPNGWRPDADTLLSLRGHAAMAAIIGADDPHRRTDGFRVGGAVAAGRVPLRTCDDYGVTDLVLHLGAKPSVSSADHTMALSGSPLLTKRGLNGVVQAVFRGMSLDLAVRPLAEARMESRQDAVSEGAILAPLTGLVTEVRVANGDVVRKGDTLVIIEAMKLIHAMTAPFDGVVSKLAIVAGETVKAKNLLIYIEENA